MVPEPELRSKRLVQARIGASFYFTKSPCEIYGHEQFGVREFQRYAGMPLYCVYTGPLYGIAASGGAGVVGYATINCV